MIRPTIHLNGTSPKRLCEGYTRAFLAVRSAIEAMEEIEFHSRDYYPQGSNAFEFARKQRGEQFDKLRDVRDELGETVEYLRAFVKD